MPSYAKLESEVLVCVVTFCKMVLFQLNFFMLMQVIVASNFFSSISPLVT